MIMQLSSEFLVFVQRMEEEKQAEGALNSICFL
jgi:hypothetical protein